MRFLEIFTIRRVTSPFFDLGRGLFITVEMLWPTSNDAIRFIESNDFTFHSSSPSSSSRSPQSQQSTQQSQSSQTTAICPHSPHAPCSSFSVCIGYFLDLFLKPPKRPFFFGWVI